MNLNKNELNVSDVMHIQLTCILIDTIKSLKNIVRVSTISDDKKNEINSRIDNLKVLLNGVGNRPTNKGKWVDILFEYACDVQYELNMIDNLFNEDLLNECFVSCCVNVYCYSISEYIAVIKNRYM